MKTKNFPDRVTGRRKRALEYWNTYKVPKEFLDKGPEVVARKTANAKAQVEILQKKLG